MAKMTKATLDDYVKGVVTTAKQAGAWNDTKDNFLSLVDKIGKQVQLNGLYNDKLPELSGDDLPLGKTIEETMIDLTLPTTYSDIAAEGAKDDEPALPSVEDCAYSYTLGRQKVKTTVPYDNVERACINADFAGSLMTDITEKLQNSLDMTKYQMKKQLLGNAATKALAIKATVPDVYKSVAIPTDAASSEDFIVACKEANEDASFAHQGGLGGAFIGAAPSVKVYILKGVMPTVSVKAVAGAFQGNEMALPGEVKVVDDFGTITGTTDGKKVFAIMIDERGIKLHEGYNATRAKENADGDFINYVRHFEETGFISKYTFIRVFEG